MHDNYEFYWFCWPKYNDYVLRLTKPTRLIIRLKLPLDLIWKSKSPGARIHCAARDLYSLLLIQKCMQSCISTEWTPQYWNSYSYRSYFHLANYYSYSYHSYFHRVNSYSYSYSYFHRVPSDHGLYSPWGSKNRIDSPLPPHHLPQMRRL